jgi:hypothetical protein
MPAHGERDRSDDPVQRQSWLCSNIRIASVCYRTLLRMRILAGEFSAYRPCCSRRHARHGEAFQWRRAVWPLQAQAYPLMAMSPYGGARPRC